ncbi:MAG: CopD family protein, partial [Gammaproteobacteria bacterium]|nr:CopD family protein [Gammaproteobacteria bacterium]
MLWIKVFHLLFVTAWMAGLFYLPRIYVHYVEGQQAGEDVRRLVTMADKLFRFSSIMAGLALGFG